MSLAGGYLHIKVSDNGIGMDEETHKRLANQHLMQAENGIGLPNIIRRLKIFYGNEAQIKIESKKGAGCAVELILPATK